jgi:hypothetical protein
MAMPNPAVNVDVPDTFVLLTRASAITVEDLRTACIAVSVTRTSWDPTLAWQVSQCLGYLSGVMDDEDASMAVSHHAMFCIQAGVTVGQLAAMYVKAADASPELWHRNASVLLPTAFGTAFPCRG